MYYKLIQGGAVADVFDSDIDEFIALQTQYGEENVEQIDKKEYDRLDKLLEEMDRKEDNDETPISFSQMMSKPTYSRLDKRIIVMNLFSHSKIPPTIAKLEEYFKWLEE